MHLQRSLCSNSKRTNRQITHRYGGLNPQTRVSTALVLLWSFGHLLNLFCPQAPESQMDMFHYTFTNTTEQQLRRKFYQERARAIAPVLLVQGAYSPQISNNGYVTHLAQQTHIKTGFRPQSIMTVTKLELSGSKLLGLRRHSSKLVRDVTDSRYLSPKSVCTTTPIQAILCRFVLLP